MGVYGPGQVAPPPYPGQGQLGQNANQPQGAPMFIAPPPRPQRLLHSEAYLKYIEGLSADCPTVSKWDQSLKGESGGKSFVSKMVILFSNTFPFLIFFFFIAGRKDSRLSREQESRLPSHWLKSKGAHTTMVDALWRLRDLMMRDTLSIRQAYNL